MTDVHVVLLGLLRQKPLYGYELKQIIEDHMGDWTDIKFGSIYFALARLNEDGAVEVVAEVAEGSRPARRVYRITEKGQALFGHLLRQLWMERRQTLYPLDIAMFFIDSLPKEDVQRYILRRIEGCETALQHLTAHETEQFKNEDIPRQGRYIFEHSRLHLEAELTWLKKVAQDTGS
jgi:DNA-binding PadR family transcriptional regulator